MATAGPNAASSATNWATNTNAFASDNQYAFNGAAPSGGLTATLILQGFGFAIPAGATVDGITVSIERKGQSANTIKDYNIQLLNGSGTAVGSNKADTSVYWPTTDGTKSYGGAADTWSASLTDTDVNSSSFGVAIRAQNLDASNTLSAYIDYVSITVNYTAASGQPMQARSRRVPFVRKARQIGW